jgi:hypothetical protein
MEALWKRVRCVSLLQAEDSDIFLALMHAYYMWLMGSSSTSAYTDHSLAETTAAAANCWIPYAFCAVNCTDRLLLANAGLDAALCRVAMGIVQSVRVSSVSVLSKRVKLVDG